MAAIRVTSGGEERVTFGAAVLSSAFQNDPVITYLLSSMQRSARIAYLPNYFSVILTAAAKNKAMLHEAGGWGCFGVLIPPHARPDNPWTLLPSGILRILWTLGIGGCRRMLSEYAPVCNACKDKGLGGAKDYYYVFIIGTNPAEEGKGLCTSIMKRFQEIAGRDGLPIWLEATTEKSMKLYEKLGWQVTDEIVLGKGEVGADGERKVDGEGLRIWGMAWWPKTKESERESI